MASAALAVCDLQKFYGDKEVVAGVSLNIAAGECVGILGPNGAGKSTTIQMCLGATKPSGGTISLLGYDMPQNALQARRRVGVTPQNDSLDPDFSCWENLLVYSRYFGIQPQEATLRALLEFAGLEARAADKISALSGGMQRRLALARALVNNPDFIFLDEPTTGLDPQARRFLWERLRRLQKEGKTLLLSTHFMEEAERLCDRVYIMDHGRVIAEGKPAELTRERVEDEVVELYGKEADAWLCAPAQSALFDRRETFGMLSYCYANNADALCQGLRAAGFAFTRRPANLEDVFLRLTGRDLRE